MLKVLKTLIPKMMIPALSIQSNPVVTNVLRFFLDCLPLQGVNLLGEKSKWLTLFDCDTRVFLVYFIFPVPLLTVGLLF